MVTKRHILDDRKVVRSLKNNEEGLPDVLRAVFLALTEEKSDHALIQKMKKKPQDPGKLKAKILELQQKDPILFRQFQREVMKQYYYYQMTHHRNRDFLVSSCTNLSDAEQERKSLVTSLKNAMHVIKHQTQFTSLVLDDEDETTVKKKDSDEDNPKGSAWFQRKKFMSPTMIVGTLMDMNDPGPE